MNEDPDIVREAREAFAKELREAQVQAEVAKLREAHNNPLWRRLLAALVLPTNWRKP
jgi:hypothetical protein